MSTDNLSPETTRAVTDEVHRAQAIGRVPTLIAAVVRDGNAVHTVQAGAPVDADTQFRIGSITKTLTATMLMQQRDRGRLSLDDPLSAHVPDTPVGRVTLRQLLGHASGLQREPDGTWWERTAGVEVAQLLAGLTADKLQPARGHHYSNLAYGLLGAVLERLTGQRWSELLGKELLGPLGMHRTTYHPVAPYALGYVVHPWHGTLQEQPRHDSGAMAPAGQLWSTVADLARWAGFLADPDPAVLDPATLHQMCAPVAISDPERWSAGHGLGLALWRAGERIYVGHAGSMPGYLSVVAVHRPSRTAVLGFANAYTMHGGGIVAFGTRLLTEVLEREPVRATPDWAPSPPPPPDLEPLCGRWWWMGQEHEVTWDGTTAELVVAPLTGRPGSAWRFRSEAVDRWRGTTGRETGETLTVHRDASGRVATLEIATLVFHRAPDMD